MVPHLVLVFLLATFITAQTIQDQIKASHEKVIKLHAAIILEQFKLEALFDLQSEHECSPNTVTDSVPAAVTENVTESVITGFTEGVTGNFTEGVTKGVTKTSTEGVTESVTGNFTEGSTEGVTGGVTKHYTDVVTESVTDKFTDSVTESVAGGVTDVFTESVTEGVTGNFTESVTEGVTGNFTGSVTEGVTGNFTESVTEGVIGNFTESVTEGVTGNFTESVTGGVSENFTESAATEGVTRNFTESVTEDVTGNFTESVTEGVTENFTESVTGGVSENFTESATESVIENFTDSVTEGVSENFTERATESVTGKFTENATEGVTENSTENVTEGVTDVVTRSVTGSVTENVTEKITEGVTEGVTKNSTGGFTEGVTIHFTTEKVTTNFTESVTGEDAVVDCNKHTICPNGLCRQRGTLQYCFYDGSRLVGISNRHRTDQCKYIVNFHRLFDRDQPRSGSERVQNGPHAMGLVPKDDMNGQRSFAYARDDSQSITQIFYKVNKVIRLTQYTSKQNQSFEQFLLRPAEGDQLESRLFLNWPGDRYALFSAEDGSDLEHGDIRYLSIASCNQEQQAAFDATEESCKSCNAAGHTDIGCRRIVACDDQKSGLVQNVCTNLANNDSCPSHYRPNFVVGKKRAHEIVFSKFEAGEYSENILE